jgi:DNA (cytosine-5)-methyltransferase 1
VTAYYNENDPKAAAWLRELIKQGAVADGEVDERSIEDVIPEDVRGFTQCHFFAGIGGWSYALRLAGWPDSRSVWTGSCPCQPFSDAGNQKKGTADRRHLWPEFYRLISECRPAAIFGEQVASADGLAWLDIVSADLENANYAVGAADLCAAGVKAPHARQRLWFVADTGSERCQRDAEAEELVGEEQTQWGKDFDNTESCGVHGCEWLECIDGKWRPTEPGTFPLANGISAYVGRLRGYGNAIVPQVAAEFIGAYLSI